MFELFCSVFLRPNPEWGVDELHSCDVAVASDVFSKEGLKPVTLTHRLRRYMLHDRTSFSHFPTQSSLYSIQAVGYYCSLAVQNHVLVASHEI